MKNTNLSFQNEWKKNKNKNKIKKVANGKEREQLQKQQKQIAKKTTKNETQENVKEEEWIGKLFTLQENCKEQKNTKSSRTRVRQ